MLKPKVKTNSKLVKLMFMLRNIPNVQPTWYNQREERKYNKKWLNEKGQK